MVRRRLTTSAAALSIGIVSIAMTEAHEVTIHRELTDLAIDYLLAQRPELQACGVPEIREALKDGVEREDDFTYVPAGNFLFHFTPRLDDNVRSRLFVDSQCSSVQWGFGGDLCSADLTFLPASGSGVNFSTHAINLRGYQDVLDTLRARPGAAKTTAIRSLGHFLHLLQDLTSPAHTHQDAHPHLPSPEYDDPSVFEVSNLTRPAFPLPLPSEALIQFGSAQQAFTMLQQFTSTNFASEKRLLAGFTPAFNSVDAAGYLRRNLKANGTPVPGGWRVARIAPVGNSAGLGRLVIDKVVAADQFEQLAHEAIRYSGSLINFVHARSPVCEQRINVSVTGHGRVTSSLDGVRPSGADRISCDAQGGSECSHPFRSGDTVTLTAQPQLGQSLLRWTGACAGAGSAPCTLAMNEVTAKDVGAEFSTGAVAITNDGTNPIGVSMYWFSACTPTSCSGGNVVAIAGAGFLAPGATLLSQRPPGFNDPGTHTLRLTVEGQGGTSVGRYTIRLPDDVQFTGLWYDRQPTIQPLTGQVHSGALDVFGAGPSLAFYRYTNVP
jgi:hypothetical protein